MAKSHQDWEFEIPREVYRGDEKKLKKRVIHFQKGMQRIFVFTVVGFIMGWFSYLYVSMGVLPLKAIVALPYKLNEMIHNMIHGSHIMLVEIDTFFPNAPYVSTFTECFMPALFGGAIYGSLSYFTGDRKVFTYKRFAKFFCVWVSVIALGIGGTFAANNVVVNQNEKLENITGFMVHSDMRGSTYMAGRNIKEDVNQAIGTYLQKAFYIDGMNLKQTDESVRDEKGEQLLCFWFGKHQGGYMECQVNAEKKYVVTEQGKVYPISEDFANMLKKFDRDKGYARYEESGEMISYEEMAD